MLRTIATGALHDLHILNSFADRSITYGGSSD